MSRSGEYDSDRLIFDLFFKYRTNKWHNRDKPFHWKSKNSCVNLSSLHRWKKCHPESKTVWEWIKNQNMERSIVIKKHKKNKSTRHELFERWKFSSVFLWGSLREQINRYMISTLSRKERIHYYDLEVKKWAVQPLFNPFKLYEKT